MPVSAPPTSLDESFFFISLVYDFLAVRFSVSFGCARRRSVSTYASILVLQPGRCVLSSSAVVGKDDVTPEVPIVLSGATSYYMYTLASFSSVDLG